MNTPVKSIGHMVVGVDSLAPAIEFYRDGLGFEMLGSDMWPDCPGAQAVLVTGKDHVVLAEMDGGLIGSVGGTHQAYRMSQTACRNAVDRLTALGSDPHAFHESRPSESGANIYIADPSGNRVQLVECEGDGPDLQPGGIDHVCVEDFNIHRAETFYAGTLRLDIECIWGAKTDDFVRAREWGEGRIDMMPGACRWVRYFRPIKGQNRMQPRPSLQIYFRAGRGTLGVFMTMEDYAEPPEEQLVGTPRIGLQVGDGALDAAAEQLDAANHPFVGPVDHGANAPIARSIYCRDTGGHFIALCEAPPDS